LRVVDQQGVSDGVPSAPQPARGSTPDTFWERLGEEDHEALLALGARHSFAEDAVLMLQDERDERLMLLLAGRVKVTRTAEGEHELLLAIRDAGELLGELAFIDGLPRTASVTALEPIEALVFGGGTFREYLQRSPRVAVALLESVAWRFRESTIRRLEFAASDTLGRLASRIMELADRYGVSTEQGIEVRMPISQDELASWTGASRAAATQGLQTLRELGWLATDRGRLVVRDADALRARAA
jgi:CRP/FNR family cyclic AMP-dependent transcriptional regulator